MMRSALVVLFGLLLSPTADSAPPPAVPAGHPRVYLRAADLPAIKAKLALPEFAATWSAVKSSTHPLSRALVYLLQGDTSVGTQAVSGALSDLKACTDGRVFESCMHYTAIVYDWCYPLISTANRSAFVTEFKRLAASHDPGYPASSTAAAVVGHGSEGWLMTGQIPIGIAIHDEEPQMYSAAAKLFVDRFVPVRNYLYAAHMHHQGDSYVGARFQHDQAAAWLFKRMAGVDLLDAQQRQVPYQLLYNLRPDGQQLRSGDTFDDGGKSNSKRRLMLLTGAYYDDPFLRTMADFDGYWGSKEIDDVLRLVLQPAAAKKSPLSDLPLSKYFAAPMGEMVARTGWTLGVDSPDALFHMRIGGTFFGNHQRKDFGTFQIYYRGALAIPSGLYEGDACSYGSAHWVNYYHQTIAHNGLLVHDPAEKMIFHGTAQANDGGQLWPNNGADHPADLDTLLSKGYVMGQVSAHQIGPQAQRPEYSYLAGDISKAYAPAKVSLVTRSMVALSAVSPTYPGALVVFDRVVSTSPAFKKTWLLHSIQQPAVQGQRVTIERSGPTHDGKGSYAGKLVSETLLPEAATLTKVGGAGKEFWVESTKKNYACSKPGAAEAGAWRVEVSPAQAASSDRFLHVLTVMKTGTSQGPEVVRVEGTTHVGAALLDRAVLFAREAKLVQSADFSLAGASTRKILVCDLQPGSYQVLRDGALLGVYPVDQTGTCLYTEGGAGAYLIKPGAAPEAGLPGDAAPDSPARDSAVNEASMAAADADSSAPRPAADGCSCGTAATGGGALWPLALLLLLGLRRRRVARR